MQQVQLRYNFTPAHMRMRSNEPSCNCTHVNIILLFPTTNHTHNTPTYGVSCAAYRRCTPMYAFALYHRAHFRLLNFSYKITRFAYQIMAKKSSAQLLLSFCLVVSCAFCVLYALVSLLVQLQLQSCRCSCSVTAAAATSYQNSNTHLPFPCVTFVGCNFFYVLRFLREFFEFSFARCLIQLFHLQTLRALPSILV